MTAAKADAQSVFDRFQPITEAEAGLVVRRLGDDAEGRSLEDVVAEVKGERIGPAAHWEETYAEARAASPGGAPSSAEDQTGVPAPTGEPTGGPVDTGLEGWVRIVVEESDDELAVWLEEHTVDEVIETIVATPDDERAAAALRVRDAEQDRGDDARTTLLDRLEKFTTEEA